MALDLTGIENVEFYSGHYLDAVLEGDLKGLFDAWKKSEEEAGKKAPFRRFGPIGAAWEKARKQAGGEPNPVERWKSAREFHAELIEVLGYRYSPDIERLEDDTLIPLASRVDRDGRPYLWIVDAPFPRDASESPLDAQLLREQYPSSVEGLASQIIPRSIEDGRTLEVATWRELMDRTLFRLDRAPRWILFLGGNEVLLAERHKWPAGRFLRFDLGALFARRDTKALQAFCALVHADALAPDSNTCLHDTLEEKSHKHAFAVSGDLKYGVRRAIELLANEAVLYRREHQKQGVFGDADLAAKLKDDCLTYMYRLLFLFYVEARGSELGIVPMKSQAYRGGYSLESLRELELTPLTTDAARNGYYIDHSLKTLFRIVDQGFDRTHREDMYSSTDEEVMRIEGLRSPLFDDARLQVLNGVRFRNHVLQEVICQLSLSAEKRGKQRGRISYAQLGISQLGAVYESLLSYEGFFADEKEGLYEVAAKDDVEKIEKARQGRGGSREDAAIYFVPASQIDRYDEAEFIRDEAGKKVRHEKGTFIYALAGRSREKTASFYTPEVLTQCVVKYALKELLLDESGKRKLSATEILALTLCEPAMGSGAFLIETIDQLADAYLEARQEELSQQIPSDEYQREKRRVKARLATNNCYGVDLNPVAVRLAQVSLWLGSMHEGGKCPWFGLRLANGNSLIGARREVFRVADVTRPGKKSEPNWLGMVPEPVSLHRTSGPSTLDKNWTVPKRPAGTIYHVLLPAEDMAAFDKDKVVKEIAPNEARLIKEWRKEFIKPFTKPDADRLVRLSDAVDRLWSVVVRERSLAAGETTDRIPVWADPARAGAEPAASESDDIRVEDQEEVARSLESTSSAYRRLKLVMDAWCALWFWPIEHAALLPTRQEWLASLELTLLGKAFVPEIETQGLLFGGITVQRNLPLSAAVPASALSTPSFASAEARTAVLEEVDTRSRVERLRTLSKLFGERRREYVEGCGLADVHEIVGSSPWLQRAEEIQCRLHFHHWELRFSELFGARGGFDVIVGNPPWIKMQWEESGILSEFDPLLALRELSASAIAMQRTRLLGDNSIWRAYRTEFEEMEGAQEFLNARQNYPLLQGIQTNLYKCCITRAWQISSPRGVSGFLHPEGIYDDPNGGALRRELFPRLVSHFQFINELRLFAEVAHLSKYSVNVYGVPNAVRALHCSNLFHPSTLNQSVSHDGHGSVPGIKNEADEWELRPHRNRIVRIDAGRLALFASLYDDSGTDPFEARLPVVHSEEIVSVLRRFAAQPRKLEEMSSDYLAIEMWHETNQQKDGTIRRETRVPLDVSEWILQGPHFHVGTPLNKTPNEVCNSHGAYTAIDLKAIPEDYLPRTNYVPACDPQEYAKRTPKWKGRPVTDYYRLIHRRIVSSTGERTLVPSLLPKGCGHVHPAMSVIAEDPQFILCLVAYCSGLPFDFLMKSTGRGDICSLGFLPFPNRADVWRLMMPITLELNCLTKHYSEIWNAFAPQVGSSTRSVSTCSRVPRLRCSSPTWNLSCGVRSDIGRRQAMVELDVLVATALELTLDELMTIYRVQFPILQQYERELLYDQHGRIVPTSTTAAGDSAVSLVRLAGLLREQVGFDTGRCYRPSDLDIPSLRARSVRLLRKDAEVLGVPERCTLGDLLTTTEVRWYDNERPDGYTVELVGLRYTDPGLEPRMERVYPTPWTRCDREEDYRVAWAEFERRLKTNGAQA